LVFAYGIANAVATPIAVAAGNQVNESVFIINPLAAKFHRNSEKKASKV
jgi:hypothetical protein